MKLLSLADIEVVSALFAEDGYVWKPGGLEFKYAGSEGVKTFRGRL